MKIFSAMAFIVVPLVIAFTIVSVFGIRLLSIPGMAIFVAVAWGLYRGQTRWLGSHPGANPWHSDCDAIKPPDQESGMQPDRDSGDRSELEKPENVDHEAVERFDPGAVRQSGYQADSQPDFTELKRFLKGGAASLFVVFASAATLATVGLLGREFAHWMIGIFVAGFATLVSLGILVVWVLPVHLYLCNKGRTGPGWYILASLPPSIGFLLAYNPFDIEITPVHVRSAWLCVLVGVCAAITFWYVAIYRKRKAEARRCG